MICHSNELFRYKYRFFSSYFEFGEKWQQSGDNRKNEFK